MDIQKNNFLSIEQLTDRYLNKESKSSKATEYEGLSFQEILKSKSDIKFSKHASERLTQRNISLSDNQLNRLNEGTKKAMEKGIKDSLVIVDELAFIVNVPNQTVVTAMDKEQATENVFTNINGAVIM